MNLNEFLIILGFSFIVVFFFVMISFYLIFLYSFLKTIKERK
jgi:hypothetical protein